MLARLNERAPQNPAEVLPWPRPLNHAGFQEHVSDLAARLATAGPESLDAAIVDGLRETAEALRLDAALLWQKPGDDVVVSHRWIRPPASSPELRPLLSHPHVMSQLAAGTTASFSRPDDLPAGREAGPLAGFRAAAIVPLALEGGRPGAAALTVGSLTTEIAWTPAVMDQLRLVAGVCSQALARQASLAALQRALDQIHQLKEEARDEDLPVRPAARVYRTSRLLSSDSPIVQRAIGQAEQVAPTPSTVLLLGETGVGKEVFAQAIHEMSARHQRPMVRVSCAAIPAALIDSELFGRERGAYTGALSRQIGRFEAANGSTLFLDEIGDLPAETQVKLLRVLQERVIERLGSTTTIKVDVRIIAATNRNLERAVEEKTFREDLFYRLNVFPIVVPPLRERVEDIPHLVKEFVQEFSTAFGKPIESVTIESMKQLQQYGWPGNVRELRNVIERAVIIATGPKLTVPIPQAPASRQPRSSMTLKDLEVEHIRATLESTNWRIRGARGAAERLGLKPTTLETRMSKLGLIRPKA